MAARPSAERLHTAAATPLLPFIEITRPRVLSLVLFTAPPALWLAQDPAPGWARSAALLVGTLLIGAACSAFNAWIERHSDGRMERTKGRPLPSGRMRPQTALVYAWALSAAGTATLAVSGGALAAGVGLATLAHYVGVYTLWLKTRTAQNIVIGGLAGAAAPLIADAGADGQIGALGWALFAYVALWTPPHFWAVALYRADEYAAAGIPMMPATAGAQGTRWRMLAYAVLCIPAALAPMALGLAGPTYGAVALASGLWLAWKVAMALRERTDRADRAVFKASITTLTATFVALSWAALTSP
jgi:protoheme IX farnesyltransferase